jgi:hypothetical protein
MFEKFNPKNEFLLKKSLIFLKYKEILAMSHGERILLRD